MRFATALAALDRGERVAREGWNGKGMFLFMVGRHQVTTAPFWSGQRDPDSVVQVNSFVIEPFIVLKTADDMVVSWTASQTDLLARDWQVL